MFPWEPVSSLDMVYVNDDFNESTPGWNITHFNNIQDGVNAVIENGTVFVYNGAYYENVEIEKTINLIGEGKNHTIINGGAGGCDTIHVTADQTTISGFSIYKNNIFRSGICLLSSNNVIIDNTIENIGYGILMEGYLGEILNNTIKDNNFLLAGICIFGQELSKWNSHTIENNSANGKTMYYYKNEDSVIVPSDAGQVILANCSNFLLQDITISELYRSIQIAFCSNITVTRNIITNNTHNMSYGGTIGIYLYDSTDIIISDNFIADIYFGIFIEESSDNQILNNTFERNHKGIYSYMSHHNTISDNNFLDTINDAIVLSSSNDNIISRNYMTNNQKGISFIYNSQNNVIIENTIKYNNDGIHLSVCVNNIIQGNTISDNGNGVYLRSFSDGNTIFGNTIKDNINGLIFNGSSLNTIKENHIINNQEYGIKLLIEDVYWEQHWSLNNLIYHNNLINNTQHAYDECYNMWDNDYPSGGNYWDDYTGDDENEDGIGDVPYNISGGSNQDCYPLMNPFGLIYEIDPDLSSVEQTSNFWTDFRIKNLFLTKICS